MAAGVPTVLICISGSVPPSARAWIAKKIGGYVYSAVVPPETDADKVGPMFDYYTKVMPIYADTFMDRWKKEYVPRLQQMQNTILDFDFEHKSLPEIMIHMEDMLDMKSEAFRIHWIINLAQFQASTDFTNAAKAAGADDVLIGKINVSPADRNWDSLKALWEMKEEILPCPCSEGAVPLRSRQRRNQGEGRQRPRQ